MKNPLGIILATFLFAGSFSAQQARLHGKIFDCKYQEALAGETVVLKEQGREVQRCVTSIYGTYILLADTGKTYTVEALQPVAAPAHCLPSSGYLIPKNSFEWKPATAATTEHNFCFTSVEAEIRLPSIRFDAGSDIPSAVQPDASEDFPDPLLRMKCILDENPSIVLEISGYASASETDALGISGSRAKRVFERFTKDYHLPADRFRIKAFGSERPLRMPDGTTLDPATLAKYPKKQRDSLDAFNRRVIFHVIAWDFPVPDQVNSGQKKKIRYDDPDQGIYLCGKISDGVFGFPLAGARIRIICDDGTEMKVMSDNRGFYGTWLYRGHTYKLQELNGDSVQSDTSRKWKTKYTACPGIWKVNTDTISVDQISQSFTMHCLETARLHLPLICFEPNTVHESPIAPSESKTALLALLQNDPGLRIELLAAINTNEKHAERLAEKRNKSIQKFLRHHGIDKNRVVMKSVRNNKPIRLSFYYQSIHPYCAPSLSREQEAELQNKTKYSVSVRFLFVD